MASSEPTTRAVLLRWTKFNTNLNKRSLEDYYGVVQPDKAHIGYKVIKRKNNLLLTMEYKHLLDDLTMLHQLGLPDEILNIILEFSQESIHLKVRIEHPDGYPFTQPNWIITEVKHNMATCTGVPLSDYYAYLVDTHNIQNGHSWSPSICIEKDVLDFIRKTLYFEYILA